MNESIHNHWASENILHWSLDVVTKEDGQLERKGNSLENFNIFCKIALGLIEQEKSTQKSKSIKRLRAYIDDQYRELVLEI